MYAVLLRREGHHEHIDTVPARFGALPIAILAVAFGLLASIVEALL